MVDGLHYEDPYKVLGVDRTASSEDIKRAFRRLALTHHPDKNKTMDDSQFKKINAAYQILIDPQKRKLYDYTQTEIGAQDFDIRAIVLQFLYMFLSTTMNKSEAQHNAPQEAVSKKKNINIVLEVTLDELWKKDVKKICVKVKKLSGDIEVVPIYVSLLNYEEKYVYQGLGDEYIDKDQTRRGDITVHVKVKEHELVRIDKILYRYDLIIEQDMTLYEMYFGLDRQVPFLRGEVIHVSKACVMKSIDDSMLRSYTCVHVEVGKGLPYFDEDMEIEKRGDLYIYFKLKLPKFNDVQMEKQDIQTFLKTYFNEVI